MKGSRDVQVVSKIQPYKTQLRKKNRILNYMITSHYIVVEIGTGATLKHHLVCVDEVYRKCCYKKSHS